MNGINWQALSVFIIVFGAVTLLGFLAARFRPGDLNRLQEWGLAGRRFGTVMSWFLIGGDVYTAYSFIAVPGLIFSEGALGFFAIPYTIIVYPLVFLILPKFWTVSRHRGYVTPADFVRERFDSRMLALFVALTGILATMPYISLQIYGIEVSIAQMGVPIEISLFIAFVVLAAYTYASGLRAPALIALVKDAAIWLIVIIAIIYIPMKLGGFGNIFAAVHQKAVQNPKTFHDILPASQYSAYSTLALGSALSLFLYPHALTGILSSNSRQVVRRNAALLPIYTLLLALIALLGYVAIADGIHANTTYGTNAALPALFLKEFPAWFSGFAFAAIAIGALAPAAIMSIASANLFTRNIYREYFRPACTEREESSVAKTASLVVKIGALIFILVLPNKLAINFQLLSNVWIIQTLPPVLLGLYTNWFHRRALLIGLIGGLLTGTWLFFSNGLASVYPLQFGPITIPTYVAVAGLVVNLILSVVLTPIFRATGVEAGEDATIPDDYEAHPVIGSQVFAGMPLQTPRQAPQPVASQSSRPSQLLQRPPASNQPDFQQQPVAPNQPGSRYGPQQPLR